MSWQQSIQNMSLADIDLRAVVAEFTGMFLFVFISVGAATGVAGEPGWVQQVALTFGFSITVLIYTIGHYSGAHMNCAVTFGLVLKGDVNISQGLANFGSQIIGSIVASAFIALVKRSKNDKTTTLGTNQLGTNIDAHQAFFGELICTFMLMYVVLETAVNPVTQHNRMMCAVAIGLTVYLAHSILIPVDGCSINPTRSFGPALVATFRDSVLDTDDLWEDHWVFWFGPLLGAAGAVGWYRIMNLVPAFDGAVEPAEPYVADENKPISDATVEPDQVSIKLSSPKKR